MLGGDGGRADHDLGAVGLEHVALVLADLVGAHEDAVVALRCATIASPTPVLPEVGSTIVPPGCSAPEASAASIIRVAMRSFTDPPGLRYSTLASTSGPVAPAVAGRSRVRESRTSGVLPMRSRTEFTYSTPYNLEPRTAARS